MNMADTKLFSGSPDFGQAGIKLSRTETETLCFKATRGGGYSWGIAEDAATATGWLCAQGIDGTSALLAALVAPTFTAPVVATGQWSGQQGRPLCPLLTGTALVDFAQTKDSPFSQPTTVGPVRQPILIVPFLKQCADLMGKAVCLNWDGKTLIIGSQMTATPADLSDFANASVATVTLTLTDDTPRTERPAQFSLVRPHTLAALNALAMRTTVPASETSRNSGAGAGTTDND